MPDVVDALVSFHAGWVQDGLGKDGLPLYRETVRIRLAKPPYTEIEREATESDFEQFAEPYAVFQRGQQGRRPTAAGYPLALWPVVNPAEFEMCIARGVFTVEQLGELKGDKLPPQIRELATRARRMIKLQGEVGKFEEIIRGLEQQVAALAEDLKEANGTISAQNSMINALRPTPAAA